MGLGQLKTTEKTKTDVRCLDGRETRVATKLQEHTCLLTPTGRSHSAAAVGGDYHFLLGRLIPGPLNRDMSPLERKQKNLALELATKPCPPLPLSVWILSPSDECFSVFSCPLPKKAVLHCNTDYLQQGSDDLPPATPSSVVSGPSSAFMKSSLLRPHCPLSGTSPCVAIFAWSTTSTSKDATQAMVFSLGFNDMPSSCLIFIIFKRSMGPGLISLWGHKCSRGGSMMT